MLALAAALAAATPVVSPAPERVALTLYRAPGRAQGRIRLDALGGFGLVTETRTIRLPAGDSVVRFEGVADGIIPASAIVTGLPGGTVEKNRDARLLSPANLIDGSLGREVTVRRTDRLTGKVREARATIVAVPAGGQGGVVMRTPEGIQTLRCAGIPEGVRFDGVPSGLSARPVLSIRTRSPHAARVRVTLAYLSSGFDWNASYVATIGTEPGTLDLSAWATLANNNGEAFPDASVKIVAGRLQRHSDREIMAAAARLELHCYPQGTTTSDLPAIKPYERPVRANDMEIVVTAARVAPPLIVSAPAPPPPPPPPPEDLGDLKLYNIPEPVTVAPRAQKQVALIAQPHVRFDQVYRIALFSWQAVRDLPATILLRIDNVAAAGMGIPLPAGTTALYRRRDDARLLLGLGAMRDTAKGEKAEIAAGIGSNVLATQQRLDGNRRHVGLSNANPYPVTVEVRLGAPGERDFKHASARLERIDGIQTWRLTLPANQTADLDYSTR
jgi:hypothetical protein